MLSSGKNAAVYICFCAFFITNPSSAMFIGRAGPSPQQNVHPHSTLHDCKVVFLLGCFLANSLFSRPHPKHTTKRSPCPHATQQVYSPQQKVLLSNHFWQTHHSHNSAIVILNSKTVFSKIGNSGGLGGVNGRISCRVLTFWSALFSPSAVSPLGPHQTGQHCFRTDCDIT